MITTSNFAKSGNHPDAVAISHGIPRFNPHVRRYLPLAPPRWLLKEKDPELFDREYRKQLDSLDAKQVVEDLSPNAIKWDIYFTQVTTTGCGRGCEVAPDAQAVRTHPGRPTTTLRDGLPPNFPLPVDPAQDASRANRGRVLPGNLSSRAVRNHKILGSPE